MDITFFYKNNRPCTRREVIISQLANAMATIIELPETLEVCLYQLGKNVYGGIDKYYINRIAINYDLDYEAIPKILTHELIHVSQKHTKLLEIKKNGHYYWRGIPYTNVSPEQLSYEEYRNLPWELDVENRVDKLLTEVLQKLV